jgi:hypothetical protein
VASLLAGGGIPQIFLQNQVTLSRAITSGTTQSST